MAPLPVGRPGPAALRPVGDHVVRPSGPVGDAAIQRLDGQGTGRRTTAHDKRVKAPAEAVDLDDVPCLNPLKAHESKGTQSASRRSGVPREAFGAGREYCLAMPERRPKLGND